MPATVTNGRASRAREREQLSSHPPSRRDAHRFGAASPSHPRTHCTHGFDDFEATWRWRRGKRSGDAHDPADRMIDDVDLAVGVDAERADVSQHGAAAEFGCVLASIRRARLSGRLDGRVRGTRRGRSSRRRNTVRDRQLPAARRGRRIRPSPRRHRCARIRRSDPSA